ncbi:MAG: ribosome biogenesis GTPase Der, partial [Caldisericia bacterium]
MFKVAIVGRPNSGKSTLFNRLIKESKATTFELPGTTRDYIYGEGIIFDKKISFLDTGGISFDESTELIKKINLQVEIAINISDLVIFLIDGSYNNIIDEDRKIAKLLHKKNKETILVLNKCDIKESCLETYLYLELGFGEPIKISSLKNIGLDNLLNEIYKRIPEEKEEFIEKNLPKIAIIGKPNTGKSTLLNSILGYERSIVSDEPGTTRDIIEHIVNYKEKEYLFFDTPGVRKGVLKDLDFYISLRSLKALKESDIVLFLISCDNISRTDEHLMSLILKNKKSGIIVINKLDLIENEKIDKVLNEISYRINEILFYPQVLISALKKININLIFKLIDIVYKNINKDIKEVDLKN